ncbi:Imm27 family immunity protein [Geminisphaera colitermitum]|uniref:Imm27 family immunity protein n=1 Tax=Geminisphaera colitermitum TaxID=1148786 RepID=UPI00019653E8|nr:Imm27 family immunity protein [Geminisphaera colitermitum]
MKLQSHETDLVGKWIAEGRQVKADTTCERIEWLITHQLQQVAFSPQWGAWETLFQDPDDGRFWERTYPDSHMHGGGPPRLSVRSLEQVRAKYQIETSP